jgi:hypothetical protein
MLCWVICLFINLELSSQIRCSGPPAEVGKMMTVYLLPLSLPLTQPVDDIAYLFKKGRIGRLMLTTLGLWEGRGRRHDVFLHLKCKSPSFDIEINKNQCRRLNH